MSDRKSPLKITDADLRSRDVQEYVDVQAYHRHDVGPVTDQPWVIRVIYANWFYLAICCTIGGAAAWAITEPFFDDTEVSEGASIAGILIFPAVAACVGLFLGAAEGIMCRNGVRALKCGAIGLGVGFLGGILAILPTGLVFAVMSTIAVSFWDNPQPDAMPSGIALLILMMGRAAAWSIAAIPAGIGQGIALREKKVIINGLVGGVLGGLLGGLLFDPISLVFMTADGQAAVSRLIGFGTIGCLVGLFVGLVEGWTKTAWLMMKKGPLAGKQFIMFKDTTLLGSTPKADIYLFKDDAIEPKHALIYNRGGKFEIEDCATADGTYVNGKPINRHVLQHGDQIVMGKTVLEFSVRDADPTS